MFGCNWGFYGWSSIGLNGVFTGAKSISFEKTTQTIDMQLSHYFTIADLLERKHQKHKEDNNFFLIADEPEHTGAKKFLENIIA